MPNWCNNTVIIRHEDPAMMARVRKSFNEGALLKEFLPIPEDLNIVAGRVGGDEDPEQIKLVEAEERNLGLYGAKNWYDWCVANWGTKWDVGADGNPALDGENGALLLGFDSAWSPPINAYEALVEMGFEIKAYYYESGMCFAGVWDNGIDDYYEFGGMTSQQVAEELPQDLDEEFGISECIAEYEEMEEEGE